MDDETETGGLVPQGAAGLPLEEMTRPQRESLARGAAHLALVETEAVAAGQGQVPPEWHVIAVEAGSGGGARRVRTTLTMDAAVLRFFRSMGPGHLRRMERVLAGYMEYRLARAVLGVEATDVVRDPKGALARYEKSRETTETLRSLLRSGKEIMVDLGEALQAETARADQAEAGLKAGMEMLRTLKAELEELDAGEDEREG